MKPFLNFLILPFTIALSACGDHHNISEHPVHGEHGHDEHAAENGAQFKKGQGITLTAAMKQAIGLQIEAVAEARVAAMCVVMLQVRPAHDLQPAALTPAAATSTQATGWITATQAAWIKPGMQVQLHAETEDAKAHPGLVTRLEKAAYATLGDFEVAVTTAAPLRAGTRLLATFRAPEPSEAVTAIPRSALLKTAEGSFVYTVNGPAYLRTPVKTGAMNEQFIEITDGLYTGDEIVASPVMSLWLAELQVLRGGKSCTCGH